MTLTTAADWSAPARARLDRHEARLADVFGALVLPEGANIAVPERHSGVAIVVRVGTMTWDRDTRTRTGRRLGAYIRRDDWPSIEVFEADSMNEPWPGGRQIALGRLKLTQRSTPQQVIDALARELGCTTSGQLDLTNQQENERP